MQSNARKRGAIHRLEAKGKTSGSVKGGNLPIEGRVATAMETISDDATQDLSSLGASKSPKPKRPS
jgi:hypothetical protein